METTPETDTSTAHGAGQLAHNSIGLGRVIGFTAGFIGPARPSFSAWW